jgi:hypothetical protein
MDLVSSVTVKILGFGKSSIGAMVGAVIFSRLLSG